MDRLKRSVLGKLMGCNIIDCMGADGTQPFHEANVSPHFEWHFDVLIRELSCFSACVKSTSAE